MPDIKYWNQRARDFCYHDAMPRGDNIVEEYIKVIKKYTKSGDTVIDFGSAGGRIIKTVIGLSTLKNRNIIGIDVSPEMISRGQIDYEYPEKLICLDASKEELPDCELLLTHGVLQCVLPDELQLVFENIIKHSKILYLIENDFTEDGANNEVFCFKHNYIQLFEHYNLKYSRPSRWRYLVWI